MKRIIIAWYKKFGKSLNSEIIKNDINNKMINTAIEMGRLGKWIIHRVREVALANNINRFKERYDKFW